MNSKTRAAKKSPAAKAIRRRKSAATTMPPRSAAPLSRWERLTASDIMRKDLVTIDRDTPLPEVERIFDEYRITGAPVTDSAGTIVGVISVRDLLEEYGEGETARPRRVPAFYDFTSDEALEQELAAFEAPAEAEETAGDVMTGDVYSVPADASLRDVARTMSRHRIHRLLVEREGRYVGLVSMFEILDALAK